jgi:uncharacterized protein (AIM24 family)
MSISNEVGQQAAQAHSLKDFIAAHADRERNAGEFEIENRSTLQINLNGKVYAKAGAMIAYRGNVKFSRKGMLEDGLGKLLKKAVTGEGMTLMKMEGQGRIYLADSGKRVHVLRLEGETICVNGNDVLALNGELDHDIKLIRSIAGALSGGLFNVRVSGHGHAAITTHGEPLMLQVSRASGPVFTDPNATVAWSGTLSPDVRADLSFGSFVGRTSGESVQMKFEGEGWVLVQPYEEQPVMRQVRT